MSPNVGNQAQETSTSESSRESSDDEQITTAETTVEGAAFIVPDELQTAISAYRTGLLLPENEIVVANENNLYVVFTDAEPQKGVATIDGNERAVNLVYEGSNEDLVFNVITATNTVIEQKGTETSISDILNTPSNYAFELVRLTDYHQSVAVRTRDDSNGTLFSFGNTTGVISKGDLSPSTLFDKAADKIRSAMYDPTDAKLSSRLREPGELLEPFLYSASFDHSDIGSFWKATPSIIDGVVLTPGTKARDFIEMFWGDFIDRLDEERNKKIIFDAADRPLIWLVQTDYNATVISDVSSIDNQMDGELVSLTANVFQNTVSLQEVMEESTPECPASVQILGGCVPVINDVILHGGAAWTSTPESEEDLVPIFGLSSWEQFERLQTKTNEYEIIGEVVATDRIDGDLPDGVAILVYDLQHVSDVNSDPKEFVKDLADSFKSALENQAKISGDTYDPVTIDCAGDTIQVGNSATISLSAQEIDKLSIKKLWTDWQIVDQTLSGGSENNKVDQEGVYEVSWSNLQDNVSPSITIKPPEDTYVGGEYLIDLVAHDGGDNTTTTLSITDS